ncbi:hypothetical protein JMJ56_10180 [Belnapia sp. T18]|uniref:Uncharacterized protein n=1 Tax=Belnapia arida TaxID=2804533 RepID=A0ABS1U115_9PROT|nr:hypothetical protein [Belnapia arida]MBL6078373.1 hypothetical protein [Belnapia arida]
MKQVMVFASIRPTAFGVARCATLTTHVETPCGAMIVLIGRRKTSVTRGMSPEIDLPSRGRNSRHKSRADAENYGDGDPGRQAGGSHPPRVLPVVGASSAMPQAERGCSPAMAATPRVIR